ncbi:uncharacterized protein [Anser cygnoides]|uniref:uncharacterized protein n=1 Tax=Anser cygnoides TaxID=8845 RepID=UPI0034D2333D
MVSTRQKTMASASLEAFTAAVADVATQTEGSGKHTAVQVLGCRVCPSLLSVSNSSSEGYACGRCAQVEELLKQVAELWEEVSRLRSIRESERETDWWRCALPSLRQTQVPAAGQVPPATQKTKVPSSHQAVKGDLGHRGEWRQVPVRGGRRAPSLHTSPSHLPLCNRYEALEHHSQNNEVDESPSQLERVSKARQLTPCIATSSVKKDRRVIVMGVSLLKGTEGPMCRPDPTHSEVCCLPGARVRDLAKKVKCLVQPTGYYPLLVFQAGNDEVTMRSPRAIKRDFRALGRLLKGSGAQVVFASVLPIGGIAADKRSHHINMWLRDWCDRQNFRFFDHGKVYVTPGLLSPDGMRLSQRGN